MAYKYSELLDLSSLNKCLHSNIFAVKKYRYSSITTVKNKAMRYFPYFCTAVNNIKRNRT